MERRYEVIYQCKISWKIFSRSTRPQYKDNGRYYRNTTKYYTCKNYVRKEDIIKNKVKSR